jgi:hypothetical protein
MATRTWSSAGSTDGNDTANYSGSGAFLTTDDLVWNATSVVDCTFTADISVKSFTVAGTYTGAFADAGFTLQITGGFSFNSGGTVTFTGKIKTTGTTATWSSSVALNNLEFAVTVGGGTITVSGTVTIAGTFTNSGSAGSHVNTGTLVFQGNIDGAGVANFGGIAGTATFQFTGTGDKTFASGGGSFGPQLGSMVINKASGKISLQNLSSWGAGSFTLTSGEVDCNTYQITITSGNAGTFTLNGGTWTGSTGYNLFAGFGTFTLVSGTWSSTTGKSGCGDAFTFCNSFSINAAVTFSHNNGIWGMNVTTGGTNAPFTSGGKSFYDLRLAMSANQTITLQDDLTVVHDFMAGFTSATAVIDINGHNVAVTGILTSNNIFANTGDETITYGTLTLTAAKSTIRYNATSGTHNIRPWSYKSLEIKGTGGTYTPSGTLAIAEKWTITAGTWDASVNNPNVNVNGNVSFAGAATYTKGSGTITLGGTTGTQTIDFGGKTIGICTMNASGATKQLSANTFTCGTWTLTAGTWDAATNNPSYSISGNVSIAVAVTYSRGTGTITLTGAGSGTQTIDFGGKTICSVTINDSGATKQFSANGFICKNLILTLGTIDNATNNPNFTVQGNVSLAAAATYNRGTGTFTMSGAGSGTQTIDFDGKSVGALIINDSGATKQFSANTFTCASLTLTAGTLDNATNNPSFVVNGNVSLSATATYNRGSGTFTLSGSGSGTQTVDLGTHSTCALVINDTGATKQFTAGGTCATLTVTNGSVSLNSQTLTSEGDVTLSGGAFVGLAGTINCGGNWNSNGCSVASFANCVMTTTGKSIRTGATYAQHIGNISILTAISITTDTAVYCERVTVTGGTLTISVDLQAWAYFWVGAGGTFQDDGSIHNIACAGGVLSQLGTFTMKKLTINGVSQLAVGTYTIDDLQLTMTGTLTVNGNIVLVGAMTVTTSATISKSNKNISVSGNVSFSATMTWTTTGGTFTLAGSSGSQTIQFNGKTLSNLTMDASGATKVISAAGFTAGTLTLTAGTWDNATNNPNITVSGAVSVAGAVTYNKGTGTITLTGSSGTDDIDFGGKSIGALTINASGCTKRFSANTFTCGNVTFTAGTIDNNTNNPSYSISGNISVAGAVTYNRGTGTITLTGATTGTQTIDFGGKTICSLTVNDTGSTKQFSAAGFSTVDFTSTAGTSDFQTNSTAFTVSGNLDLSGGTTAMLTGGTLTMSGTAKTVRFHSGQNLYNVVINGTISYHVLSTGSFKLYGDLTVNGTFNLDLSSLSIEGTDKSITMGVSGVLSGLRFNVYGNNLTWNALGTISNQIGFYGNLPTFVPRIWNGNLILSSRSGTITCVVDAGSHTFNGGIQNVDMFAGSTYVLDLSNNPTFNIPGTIGVGFGTTTGTFNIIGGSSTFNVSYGVNLTGVDSFSGSNNTTWNLVDTAIGTFTMKFGGFTLGTLAVNHPGSTVRIDAGTVYCVTFTLTAGTWDAATNNPSLNVSGNISIAGAFTYTKGTGTITLSGSSGTQTIDFANKSIENLTFDCAGATKRFSANGFTCLSMSFNSTGVGTSTIDFATNASTVACGAITYTGYSGSIVALSLGASSLSMTNLTMSDTTGTLNLSLGTAAITVTGNINMLGVDSISGTPTWNLTGSSGTQTIEFFYMNMGNIVVNASGATKQFSTNGFICTNYTVTAGTVDNATNNPAMTINGNMTIAVAATYTCGTGALSIAGTTAQAISCGTHTVEPITVTNNTAKVSFTTNFITSTFYCAVIGAELEFTVGKTFEATSSLIIAGNSTTDTNIHSSSSGSSFDFDLPANTQIIYCDIKDFHNTSGTTEDVSFCDDMTGNSGLNFHDSYIWSGLGTGNLASTGANWIGGTKPVAASAILYSDTGTKNCTFDLSTTHSSIDIATGYSGTIVIASASLTLTAGLTVNDGTLDAGTATITIPGTFAVGASGTLDIHSAFFNCSGNIAFNSAATITKGTGAIVINGTAVQNISLGDQSVHNIYCYNITSLVTFSTGFIADFFQIYPFVECEFGAGEDFHIIDINWTGTDVSHVFVESTTPGSHWHLNVSGTATVNYVDASDSDASGGIEIMDLTGVDNGGNTHWTFHLPTGKADIMDDLPCGSTMIPIPSFAGIYQ